MTDIDVESPDQREAERRLNDDDRGERSCALPRPYELLLLCIDGHQTPVGASAAVIAALTRRHAAVDRTAGNCAADTASHCAEQAVTDDARSGHSARNAADYGAGRRRRAAAITMPVIGAPIIVMMAVTGTRFGRNRDGRRRGGRKCNPAQDFVDRLHVFGLSSTVSVF